MQELDWRFYALFLAAFIAFAPIPGAVGLLAAWAVAMWMPRSARRVLGWTVAIALVGGLWWWARRHTRAHDDLFGSPHPKPYRCSCARNPHSDSCAANTDCTVRQERRHSSTALHLSAPGLEYV